MLDVVNRLGDSGMETVRRRAEWESSACSQVRRVTRQVADELAEIECATDASSRASLILMRRPTQSTQPYLS